MPDLASVMLDIETLSSRYNAAIVSIGAVSFDENVIDHPSSVSIERRFYRVIDLTANPTPSQLHLDISPDTIYWWLQQNESARRHIIPPDRILDEKNEIVNRVTLRSALIDFKYWYEEVHGGKTYAFGATLHHVIMQNAYNAVGIYNPISYRHQLCMRTVISMANIPCPELDGLTQHVAVDDCIRQVIWFQNAKRFLLDGGHARLNVQGNDPI